MADDIERHSTSVEDYLKAVLALGERGETASTSALARALEVQPASVTGMVKRLAEAGLLEHVPYRGARLTERGRRTALRILRRHRILETYLTQRLGYGWDEVHAEAELLEHAASDRLVEAMADALGFPEVDPHGAPIPSVDGELARSALQTLADAPSGVPFDVRAVRDDDAEHLIRMEAKGLLPGVRVEVVSQDPATDEIRVRVGGDGGDVRTVSARVARRVFLGSTE